MHREVEIAAAFIELSNLHGQVFDEARYADWLARFSARLVDVDASGVLLTRPDGTLAPAAISGSTAQVPQLVELRADDGPGITSFRTRTPVAAPDLRAEKRWQSFRSAALKAGFAAAHAIPLLSHGEAVGAITLFRERGGPLGYEEDRLTESLAATVSACLLSRRAVAKAENLAGQLQTALHTRIEIEQAKGILAERHGVSVSCAFECMRSFARRDRRRLAEVARAVIEGSPSVARLLGDTQPIP
ncbi:ANTAR domain-containing protein [Amycolatopsis alkalitolerans]|uniref:GAF and ANTAR domain-containing protein n=1 Tax=Amycolatopsis alkalitolerans TaxID=2547244 RepID=A0A5C4M5A2_9PSEU|nr:GAF and ANTAR domain-containing protein [Amycolatopsis alkalitolerans]TNC27834.1 GAF and ANTAR domain-containing protein [Amycolatopsis alkalitolerans]